MDEGFLLKSMFTWCKEMLNLDQQVTNETILIAAQAICERMGQTDYVITEEWISKFKDRYGIRTEQVTTQRQPSTEGRRRRKLSHPVASQELTDKRARLGKSSAVDQGSEEEQEKEQEDDKDASDIDSLCGFSFEELNSVPEYKPHQCQHCSERYLWGHQLREHMKCHSDVKTFLCTICGKSYKSPHNLKIHMRVHTGDRPYVCKTCGKGFREHSALIKHIRIHTGERPFLCSDCGSSFISKTQLNIHVKTHHSEGLPKSTKRKYTRHIVSGSNKDLPSASPGAQGTSNSSSKSSTSENQKMVGTSPSQPSQSRLGMDQSLIPSQLLPGTGFYVPAAGPGSISTGSPAGVNQFAAKIGPDFAKMAQEVNDGSSLSQGMKQSEQAQQQLSQDFLSAAQSYMFQENYYYNNT